MIPRVPAILGIVLGLGAAYAVMEGVGHRAAAEPVTGPMLADAGGRVRSVVMQYAAGSDFVWPVYREYLAQQSPDLKVYLACPERADFEELAGALGEIPCKLTPVLTHHAMTSWSRDRWVALAPTAREKRMTLLAPKGEDQGEIWPQRAGDARIAEDLAGAYPALLDARRSGLMFDGGDFLADGAFVFATRAVVERNLQHTVPTRDKLLAVLAGELQREVVLMDGVPDHHAGMYMMAAGKGADGVRRMVVADPSLGKTLFDAAGAEAEALEGGADFSAEAQRRFDAAAGQVAELGYRVVRMPVVPSSKGRGYLTYVNVILDAVDGRRVVYMPVFAGQARMNAAAMEVWRTLGYEVRPINCSTVWSKGGTLHCLVNVLERDPE